MDIPDEGSTLKLSSMGDTMLIGIDQLELAMSRETARSVAQAILDYLNEGHDSLNVLP